MSPEQAKERLAQARHIATSAPCSTVEWSMRVLTIAVVLMLAFSFYLLQQVFYLKDSTAHLEQRLEQARTERKENQHDDRARDCLGLRMAGAQDPLLDAVGCSGVLP